MPIGGRDGYISYYEGRHTTSFYWEFGGGDVVAIIHTGLPPQWSTQQREMMERVIHEVIRQRAPTCKADIDETGGYIYFREHKPAA
jgi:hypothetical protein